MSCVQCIPCLCLRALARHEGKAAVIAPKADACMSFWKRIPQNAGHSAGVDLELAP